jgi:acyl-CoA thioesterase FadM
VIYGDTDQMGFVYYGNYLRYFEIARNEFLRLAGARYRAFEETHRLMLPVVEAQCATGGRRATTTSWRSTPRSRGARRLRALRLRDPPPARRRVAGRRPHRARLHRREGRVARIPTELRAALRRTPQRPR